MVQNNSNCGFEIKKKSFLIFLRDNSEQINFIKNDKLTRQ